MLLKEDKKKNWGTHPHFYNKWVQNLTFSWNYWYIKTARVIFLAKCCQNHKAFLFLLIKYLSSGARSFSSRLKHCTLNRKLDNHAMRLVLPLCWVYAILKNKKILASFPLQIHYCRTFNIYSHIVLLQNWEK